jgi:(2Fe-2S) ferredoxin
VIVMSEVYLSKDEEYPVFHVREDPMHVDIRAVDLDSDFLLWYRRVKDEWANIQEILGEHHANGREVLV